MRLLPPDLAAQSHFSLRWLTPDGIKTYEAGTFFSDVIAEKDKLSRIGIKAGDKVGIRGDNSYLWLVSDVALAELDAVSVAFPAEFKDRSLDDLILPYGLVFLLLSDADKDNADLNTTESSGTQNRSSIAVMGALDPSHHRARQVEEDPYPVTEDDHSFVFSSGTSGAFKGMVISKKGVLDQIETFGNALGVTETDQVLLFMPFSSLQNRVLYYGAIMRGVALTAVPSPQLLDGLKLFQPTLLIAPPIFYEAVEKSIKAALKRQPAPVLALLSILTGFAGLLRPIAGGRLSAGLLRRVYGKAHAIFGGRIRVLVTGMAKIGQATLAFYQSIGLPLIQVYGLTECGVVCANTLSDNEIGTVGKPLPGNTISLAEDGEIFVRKAAPQTSRFFHFEASTEDTRFEDGGVYTGDLGRLSDNGRLTLVGRKNLPSWVIRASKFSLNLLRKRWKKMPVSPQLSWSGSKGAASSA